MAAMQNIKYATTTNQHSQTTCKNESPITTSSAPAVDRKQTSNDNLLQYLDNPLWLLTVRDDLDHGCRPNGMIIAHVAPAGLPSESCAHIMIECSNTHKTTQIIQRTRRFILHLLSSYQYDLVAHFGLQSGHRVDKFAQLDDNSNNISHSSLPATTNKHDNDICRTESVTRPAIPTMAATGTAETPLFTLANAAANDPASTTVLPVILGTCGWMECEVIHTVMDVVPNATIFIATVKQQHAFMNDKDVGARRRALCSAVQTAGYDRKWILTKGLVYAQSTDIFQQHSRQLQVDTKMYQVSTHPKAKL